MERLYSTKQLMQGRPMNVLKSVLILRLYAMKLLCYQPQQNFPTLWRCSDFSKDTKGTLLPAIDETDVSSTSNRWVFWLALKAISVSIRNPQLLKLHTVCKMLTCGRVSDNDPNPLYPPAVIPFSFLCSNSLVPKVPEIKKTRK